MKKIIIIVGIVVMGVVAIIFYWNVSQPTLSLQPPSFSDVQFSDDPEILKQQVTDMIANSNICEVDNDCIVAPYPANCPFGCYNLIHKKTNISVIEQGINKYTAIGSNCMYKCARPPENNELRCENNKCIDGRVK